MFSYTLQDIRFLSQLSTATAVPESVRRRGIAESILNEEADLVEAHRDETALSAVEGFVAGSRKYSRALLESTSKHSRLG